MSINKVILVGNVGKDPVVRYFDKGVAKATFPLATSESYTNQQGESITSTEWHNIVLWRSLAEVAEKTIRKGSQVYIVGKIKTRSYADKDGVNKYITEILADTLLLLEKKQGTGASAGRSEYQAGTSAAPQAGDPAVSYRNQTENLEKAQNSGGTDPFAPDTGLPDNKSFQENNEDDLPF